MDAFAVLLDRDGTIIEDRHYLADPDGVVLLPGAGEALALLQRAGCRLFVVSNQSGVGRGLFPESAVRACGERLEERLAAFGVRLDDAVWCPHAPEQACDCRKPRLGLWRRLAARHGLCASRSVMIGDKLQDVDFALNAGLAQGILVLTGKGQEAAASVGLDPAAVPGSSMPLPGRPGTVVVPDLYAAACFVLQRLDAFHGKADPGRDVRTGV